MRNNKAVSPPFFGYLLQFKFARDHGMTIDKAIAVLGSLLLAALTLVLARNKAYKIYPVFFAYQIWCLFSTFAGEFAASLPPAIYFRFYLVNISVDSLFQFAVLAELGYAVAGHNRNRSPRWTLIGLLVLPAALALRSLSNWSLPANLTDLGSLLVRMQQDLPVLLLAFLLALIWWSRLQGFRWPDFALHIASGLGFYFIVCLVVAIIHTHQHLDAGYRWADVAQAGSYLFVLSYWLLKLA
jgi:hypothetical protein